MSTSTLHIGGRPTQFVDLGAALGERLGRFPWLMRIFMENVLRRSGGTSDDACEPFHEWLKEGHGKAEIAFYPGRLIMHDTTCVPALVDMASMRDVMDEAGGDPEVLDPVLPVDVTIDHSVAVDFYGASDSLVRNMAREIGRNAERYSLIKWATQTFRNVRVHAPGTGIMHTINLEQLATIIDVREKDGVRWAMPDTVLGTDSHTPMINGIGVLGWGVGGLEAESVMFGMPAMIRIPDVIGVYLKGRPPEGVLSTDLALTVTERLRRYGLSSQFVEFFGPGVSALSAGDRAVVANMAPEYGASSGYFPIDERTIAYLAATGRSSEMQERVRTIARRQGLWFDPDCRPRYTDVIEIDLSQTTMSLAGPRLPQQRLAPEHACQALEELYGRSLQQEPGPGAPPDGAVAIASITSCTNTTDPRLIIAAGLVARRARKLGLKPASWVKTSLAPGSPAAERYLRRSGLLEDLAAVGFDIVGFGCATCIGNSGPLEETMAAAAESGTAAVAVLSGNRNFPGRIHPHLKAGFLASPPLVVAFALAGDANRNIKTDPIGKTPQGVPVFLKDLWPCTEEIDRIMREALEASDVAAAFRYAGEYRGWRDLPAPSSICFPWNERSTYVRRPPFVKMEASSRLGCYKARPLLVLGDDVTTDHISPAGAIPPLGDAGEYLIERGENKNDLNVFASRRGNWEVMLRGLFTNPSVHNLLDDKLPPGTTHHAPSKEALPLWRAALRYEQEGVSTVVVAGERYGTGSSRDWAAKGLGLLGVRAVLACSFERIHRSNLIGMGILPLCLSGDCTPLKLGLVSGDWIEIDAPEKNVRPWAQISLRIIRENSVPLSLMAAVAVETALEIELLRAGGMMPLILQRAMRESSS